MNYLKTQAFLAAVAIVMVTGVVKADVDLHNAHIDKLQATTSDCFYFSLQGVTTPDPAVPGGWLAMLRSQANAQDQYAMLMAAKLSNAPVWIRTSGTNVCGYVGVRFVILE